MSETVFISRSEAETAAIAARLSLWARPGAVVLLQGELGAGKSVFARGFIQALAGRNDFDIPSPTFTLVQSYDETRIPVFHADLYRLVSAADIAELGLSDLLGNHVGLVEWAERLGERLTSHALVVNISGTGDERRIAMRAEGQWATALERNGIITEFLNRGVSKGRPRHFLEGDASARRYEWIDTADGTQPILMDMATRPDGPPVKDGKPYSAIAHLAEGLTAVVAVNTELVGRGYSAPRIFKADISHGLALIENLGDLVYGKMLLAGADMREPMLTAAELLADMATQSWPTAVRLPTGESHNMSSYDADAQLIEIDLLVSWFFPYRHGTATPPGVAQSFADQWRKILPLARQASPQWVLRDFHSPNLIWIPQRSGIQRVGLIDTQDALLGHGAYDLVSMTQDARVDIPAALAEQTVRHYLDLRRGQHGFSSEEFMTAYAVLGAQRATKILGIFARLSKRDGKHGYLRHMPRVSRALAKNLEHPALAELKQWFADNMPDALTVGAA